MTLRRMNRLRVLLELADSEDLAEVTVQPDNRDMVRWDRARAAKGWPALSDAPLLFQTFLAWAAIRRLGSDIHTGDYESFETRCVEITAVDADGNEIKPGQAEGEPLDPTQ